MNKYNAAIIGTGRIGFTLGFDKKREQPASHSFALYKNKNINIVAACDINTENLNLWQKHFPHALTFSNADDMLSFGQTENGSNFDIIVVAVNEESHLECALKAIQARPKILILEKPVALNLQQAFQIKTEAEKYNVPVMVNHERRFSCDYKIAKSWMNKIGALQCVNARLFSGLRVYRVQDEATGFYSLLHDGTHLVDIVHYLLNYDCETETLLSNAKLVSVYKDDENAVRNLCVNFEHKNCPDVNVYISGRSRFFGFEIEVVGTEGKIEIGNGFSSIYKRAESKLNSGFYSLEKLKSVKFPRKTGYFSNMIQNAVDFLDGKASLKSTLQNGIDTLQVLEEMKAFCKE